MITIEKFGDWGLVMNLAANMANDTINARRHFLKLMGNEVVKIAKDTIENQLSWAPLSPKYAAEKERRGQGNKIYIATETYLSEIKSRVNSDGTQCFVGVDNQAREKNGESISMIAKVMEYGSVSRHIPARPLWRPVMMEVYDRVRKDKLLPRETLKRWKQRTNGKG